MSGRCPGHAHCVCWPDGARCCDCGEPGSEPLLNDATARVLTGQASYDDLPGEAQAVVRARWDQQIADDVAALDLTTKLRASGKPFYAADADGNVITHGPHELPR